jgi:hypothetical protein
MEQSFRIVIVALRLGAFGAALDPGLASAAPAEPGIDLEWSAPAQCPGREAFLGELIRALGSAPAETPGKVRVDMAQPAGGGWEATVHIEARGITSDRVFRAETCQTVASAAALVAAVALEATSQGATGTPESSTPRRSAFGPTGPAATPESQLVVGAAATLDVGTLPYPGPGAEGTLAWAMRFASFRVRVGVSGAVFKNESIVLLPSNEGGSFSLVTAGGRACGAKLVGPVEIGPCLGGEVDRMGAAGIATHPEERTGVWGALTGSAFGSWIASRGFGVTVRADGVLPFARPPFVITRSPPANDMSVHRAGPLSFRASLGIEIRFF